MDCSNRLGGRILWLQTITGETMMTNNSTATMELLKVVKSDKCILQLLIDLTLSAWVSMISRVRRQIAHLLSRISLMQIFYYLETTVVSQLHDHTGYIESRRIFTEKGNCDQTTSKPLDAKLPIIRQQLKQMMLHDFIIYIMQTEIQSYNFPLADNCEVEIF